MEQTQEKQPNQKGLAIKALLKDVTPEEAKREVWKDITDYEGLYQISNLGRVRSVRRKDHPSGGLLDIREDQYLMVDLHKHNKPKRHKVHRLVAKHFIDNPNGFRFVNHKDGNKHNSRAENLEWCTSSQNQLHAYAIGLMKSQKGENNGNAKMTDREVAFARYIVGLYPIIHPRDIAAFYSMNTRIVREILHFKQRPV